MNGEASALNFFFMCFFAVSSFFFCVVTSQQKCPFSPMQQEDKSDSFYLSFFGCWLISEVFFSLLGNANLIKHTQNLNFFFVCVLLVLRFLPL